MSYKKIIINNESELSYESGYMLIKIDLSSSKVFLDDVNAIMINSLRVNITTYLINEIMKRNINLLFCNETHNPSSQLLNLYSNNYGKLYEQINYSIEAKRSAWNMIIKEKISMQNQLLNKIYGEKNYLKVYIDELKENDDSNCEAFAAKVYFNKLFGRRFNRRDETDINSALNYGYAIILSMINRIIMSHGYNASIGINHCNHLNKYNLSCDLIEPFRPLVDYFVFNNIFRKELDVSYKKDIIKFLSGTIIYKNKSYIIENAIEVFLLDLIKVLNGNMITIGEFEFDFK